MGHNLEKMKFQKETVKEMMDKMKKRKMKRMTTFFQTSRNTSQNKMTTHA